MTLNSPRNNSSGQCLERVNPIGKVRRFPKIRKSKTLKCKLGCNMYFESSFYPTAKISHRSIIWTPTTPELELSPELCQACNFWGWGKSRKERCSDSQGAIVSVSTLGSPKTVGTKILQELTRILNQALLRLLRRSGADRQRSNFDPNTVALSSKLFSAMQ